MERDISIIGIYMQINDPIQTADKRKRFQLRSIANDQALAIQGFHTTCQNANKIMDNSQSAIAERMQ